MQRPVGVRMLAEGLGTAFLLAVIVGSGIAAETRSDDAALQLLANSTAIALGLVALILCFGQVSGAHLNPAVTLAERVRGRIDTLTAGAYVAAQLIGACIGAIAANVMFELPAVDFAGTARSGGALVFSEALATFGLVTIIYGVVHSGRSEAVPFAVGGYIGAALWFTSSTAFANPAVTVARTLSDSYTGIAPADAPPFILAQLVGATTAVAAARILFPNEDPDPDPEIPTQPVTSPSRPTDSDLLKPRRTREPVSPPAQVNV